jgi:hypothetical protein
MICGARRSPLMVASLVAAAAFANGESRATADDALQERIDRSLERAAAWLESRQADDGGWHSAVYGQMGGGAGNTAHILSAMSRLPRAIRVQCRPSTGRAIDFLFRSRGPDGFVQAPDKSSDYPNYATALTLSALATRGGDGEQWISELRDYLIAAQQAKRLPWESDDGGIGSWGLVGGASSDPSSHRDGNLSTTRTVLEALDASGGVPNSTSELAVRYVTRLQNADGGFRFAYEVNDPLNKAGVQPVIDHDSNVSAKSYGTATADGLCALVACGVAKADPRVRAAVAWLDDHGEVESVPGWPDTVEIAADSSAREGLRFYYYAALADAMLHFPDAEFVNRRAALVDRLLKGQSADGSWINVANSQREDDPLIATAWAVAALSSLQRDENARGADP